MEKQTFVEYVIDIVTDKYYSNLSEDFRNDMLKKMEAMYKTDLEISYKKGHSAGYIEGIDKIIETLNTK